MAILTSAECDAVRAAIDTSLKGTQLPNATILLDIYAGEADDAVIKRDPDAESRSGDEATLVKRAATYYCASLLVPAVVRLTSVSTQARDLNIQRNLVEPGKLADELWARGDGVLDQLLQPSANLPERPRMFTTARAGRAQPLSSLDTEV